MSEATISSAPSQPEGLTLRTTPIGRLIGAGLLDSVLMLVTLGIGWVIWGAITAGEGQTPAKKLMRMRVVGKDDGRTVTWGTYVFLRGLVGGLILSIPLVGTVLFFMPLWDRLNQSVGGKVSNTVVVDI